MAVYVILGNKLVTEQTIASNFNAAAQILLETYVTLPIKFVHALDL